MKKLLPALTAYLAAVALFAGCVGPGGYSKTGVPPAAKPAAPVYSNVMFAPQVAPRNVTHVVEPGETLYRISKTYGVTVDALMRANRLKDARRIQRGQTLTIPGVFVPAEPLPRRPVARDYPSVPLFPNNGHWKYLVVHHTATKDGDKAFIDKVHRDRGFGELGYHFLIDNGTRGRKDGEIEIGNRWYNQRDGAHTKADNMNHKGIGICLVGNFSEQKTVSDAQLEALAYLVNLLREHYHIPKWRIVRHRDVRGAATECPGNNFPWAKFRRMLD